MKHAVSPVLLFFDSRLTPKADLSCWNFAMRSYSNNLLEWYRCGCYNLRWIIGLLFLHLSTDILYDSWSPAMTVSSVCISILSMLSSSPAKVTYFFFYIILLEVVDLAIWLIQILITATPSR